MPIRTLENYRNHNRLIRENYRRNPQITAEAQQDAIALMLTEYGMNEASLQEKSTVRKVQEGWNRRYDTYRALSAEFCASMTPQELRDVMRLEDGGRKLSLNFRKFLAARDRIPEGVADSLRPTAAGRIQNLKNRINRGEFQTPEARRRVMAEILAARESVRAGRSGMLYAHANLSDRITDDVSVRADQIEQELQNIPEETLNRLYRGLSGRTFGGAMQEQLEPLRKSEAKRALSTIYNNPDLLSSENIRETGAEVIWLLRHQNMTDEAFREARENGTMTEEIEALRNSEAYSRFVSGMDEIALSNLFVEFQKNPEETTERILNAMSRAENEVERRNPWAGNLYDRLITNPQELGKVQDIMGRLTSPEKLQLLRSDNDGVSPIYDAAIEFSGAFFQMEDKKAFMQNAEKFRHTIAFVRGSLSEKGWNDMCSKIPELRELEETLALPERITAANVDLMQRSAAETAVLPGELEQLIVERAALYEQVKDSQDPENVEIDRIKLKARANELIDAFNEAGASVADITSMEKMKYAVTAPGFGKEAFDLYQECMQKNLEKKERIQNQTAEERIEELSGFPEKQAFLKKNTVTEDDIVETMKAILAERRLQKEYARHPEKFTTVQDVETARIKYLASYRVIVDYAKEKIGTMNSDLILADNDGKALEEAFEKTLIGACEIDSIRDIDESIQPTARKQIEGLQDRIRKDNFVYFAKAKSAVRMEKLQGVAQILAAREVMNVRSGMHGGDARLDQKMNDAVYNTAEGIYKNLRKNFTEQEQQELIRQSVKGHGGELQKTYQDMLVKKAAGLDEIPKDLPKAQLPTAKIRIETMQKKLAGTQDPGEKRRYLAQIIAARQSVKAVRGDLFGGDDKLNKKLDPSKLAERVNDVEDYLSRMPQNKLDRMYREAQSGHGGSMMEQYQEENTYKKEFDRMKEQFQDPDAPKPDIAKALVIGLKAADPNARDKWINESGVRNTAAQLRNDARYTAFSEDPEVRNLLAAGDTQGLTQKWHNTVPRAENENLQEGPEVKKEEENIINNQEPEGMQLK